jgi:hypothetical protein
MPADMITVGEALNHRSDLQKRIAQLEERLRASVLEQEGEEPPEQPEALIRDIDAHCTELQRLIAQINHSNASTKLPSGETVTEALARRDVLGVRAGALRAAIRAVHPLQPVGDPDGAPGARERAPAARRRAREGAARAGHPTATAQLDHAADRVGTVGSREGRAPRPAVRPKDRVSGQAEGPRSG